MALGKNALGNISAGQVAKGRDVQPLVKSRLGRGLNSLIKVSIPGPDVDGVSPDVPVHTSAIAGTPGSAAGATGPVQGLADIREATAEVPILSIRPNPHQPRRQFAEGALRELADSIKSNGVIQPLVVRRVTSPAANTGAANTGPLDAKGQQTLYELIAGERRWRAAQMAGLKTVPCHVKEVDSLTQAQMALVENIQREDLNPVERAEGYRTLLTQLGLTQSELAIRLGEERSTIANFIRLLDLAEPAKRLLRDGQLSVGHAKLIAGVADILEQERLAQLVVGQALSVRNLEKLLASGGGKGTAPGAKTAKALPGREAHYAELEKSIGRQLGLRVQLKASKGKGKGKITLHYGSLDQFDQLMGKLGVDAD